MRFTSQIVAAAVGVGLMSGAVQAASGVFQLTEAKATSAQLSSVAMAQQLLNGQLAHSSFKTGTSQVVNFDDPNNAGGKWHFGNKTPFLIDTPGVDNYFAVNATGTLVIPTAGNYTFGVNSDDGFSLTVGTFSMGDTGTKASGDILSTFNFTKAGNYALNLTYFQGYGQAQVELFASPGSFTTFGATGSNFQLINNTPTTGALQLAAVPEPTSLAILGIGAASMLRRRRR